MNGQFHNKRQATIVDGRRQTSRCGQTIQLIKKILLDTCLI